jgi:3-oxoacyl-[acyl-carrier-protein] synthase II
MGKKVYILDYDLISPLGCGKGEVFKSLKDNFSAENTIKGFGTTGFPFNIAAEVTTDLKHFYRNEKNPVKTAIRYDRKFELAVSVFQFMKKRLIPIFDLIEPKNKGILFGMGADVTPFEMIEDDLRDNLISENPYFEAILQKNKECRELNLLCNPYDLSALYIAEQLQLAAFQQTCLTACAASNQAVGLAFRALQHSETELILAGGSDSIINALAFASFYKLGVLAGNSQDGKSCKPFDINRNGTLSGEASGLCVLANEDFVGRNKIRPLFEVLAFGNTLDAWQITSPDPEGKGMKRALKEALHEAGIRPDEIDYINLHGTGTWLNDQVELKALREVLGPSLKNIPVSSTKDRHGHAIAAAGIQELAILCMSLENNFIPCNRNLEKPIDTENVDLVQFENRWDDLKIGMNCNYSFGGVNTVVIIKKIN